ncbi:MAG: helix-turn-helix transcriptional regulator [Bacteroidetes bacterium]|nr:helix-turn-helix transcriptional regulator [Bacteroidota bacterium]
MINVRNYELVKAIGNKIRETRISKGLSQEELSYESDLPLSQIGRIERGENNPTVSSLFAISKALKVELKDIIDVTFIERQSKKK